MERIEAIKTLAMDHAARGIYDNSSCRSGMERVAYAKFWLK